MIPLMAAGAVMSLAGGVMGMMAGKNKAKDAETLMKFNLGVEEYNTQTANNHSLYNDQILDVQEDMLIRSAKYSAEILQYNRDQEIKKASRQVAQTKARGKLSSSLSADVVRSAVIDTEASLAVINRSFQFEKRNQDTQLSEAIYSNILAKNQSAIQRSENTTAGKIKQSQIQAQGAMDAAAYRQEGMSSMFKGITGAIKMGM